MRKVVVLLFIIGTIALTAVLFKNSQTRSIGISPNSNEITTDTGMSIKSNNFVPSGLSGATTYSISIPTEYEEVATTSDLTLYLKRDTVSIAIKNKINGYVWFSNDPDMDLTNLSQSRQDYYSSGIHTSYYLRETTRTVTSNAAEKTYKVNSSGFTVTIDHANQMFKYDLIVSIEGNELKVNVPYDSINQYDEKLFTTGNTDNLLSHIAIFPGLGSAEQKDNGYFVVPDGAGALVNLSDVPTANANFSKQIYDRDTGYLRNSYWNDENANISWDDFLVKPLQSTNMPLYAVIHDANENGMLVVSEDSSAPYAFYNYLSKSFSNINYETYFSYRYRQTFEQGQSSVDKDKIIISQQKNLSKFDINQTYIFLSPEQSTYVGAAQVYSDKLVSEGKLLTNLDSYSKTPLKVDILGSEVDYGLFGVINVGVTKYDQAVSILKQLDNDGYNELDVTYKTMTKSNMAFRFDILSRLGGNKGLSSLVDYTNENNINFAIYSDYTYQVAKGETVSATRDSALKLNRSVNSEKIMGGFYYNQRTNPKRYAGYANYDITGMDKYDIDTMALQDFKNGMFTFYDGREYSRIEAHDYIIDALDVYKEKGKNVSLYSPTPTMYKYTDKYYDAPISSSSLRFTDADIPFLQLVISGKLNTFSAQTNYLSDEQDSLLRMVEYNVYPSVLLTGESVYEIQWSTSTDVYVSEYEFLKNRINKYYTEISTALDQVIGAKMTNHEYIDLGVVKVTYSNGKEIFVNYNNTAYTTSEVTIAAKGYVVV